MTTPGLNVYQLKRSKNVKHYSNILHAANDPTLMRLFALDYFDSVLLTGDYQAKDIRYLEKQRGINQKELVTVGCAYLDTLKTKIDSIDVEKKNFTVLVSPSWGKSGLLTKYGEKLLTPLVETGWDIIIRPHPQSKKSENQMLLDLQKKYRDCKNVSWDFERDNIYSMKKSDIMITDFSGIIYDYTFLCDKPFMYTAYDIDLMPYDAWDLEDNGKNIWQYKVLKEIGVELKEDDFSNIKEKIASLSNNKDIEAARLKAKNEGWMYRGKAAEKTVDYMINKIQ